MLSSRSVSEYYFHWHSVGRAALRCSFSSTGREQFPQYPPDGTFLPEIRFQAVELHVAFLPRRRAAESDACRAAVKTQKAGKNESPGECGRQAYSIFISENMEQKSSVLSVVGQRLAECGPES